MILISAGGSHGVLYTPEIAKKLSLAGHDVEVFLEPEAKHFVGRAAFADLVLVVPEPTQYPDAVLFAPANTATIARLAQGLGQYPSDELYAGGLRPAFVVLDLDPKTASHPAVLENLRLLLREDGCTVLGNGGTFLSATEVTDGVLGGFEGPLSGLRVVVTAGGTREPIDSVRFVGNRSSGKMGLAVAREACRMGAEVSVVAANVGDVGFGVEVYRVESVDELREATLRAVEGADALVMAAAVSDFKPAHRAEDKIRRHDGLVLEMVPTEDVLKEVRRRNPGLFMVGFAASHGDPRPDAREKLRSKDADLIVGNDISRPGLGFGSDENEVYIVGECTERFVLQTTKTEVARAILDSMTLGIHEGRRR